MTEKYLDFPIKRFTSIAAPTFLALCQVKIVYFTREKMQYKTDTI